MKEKDSKDLNLINDIDPDFDINGPKNAHESDNVEDSDELSKVQNTQNFYNDKYTVVDLPTALNSAYSTYNVFNDPLMTEEDTNAKISSISCRMQNDAGKKNKLYIVEAESSKPSYLVSTVDDPKAKFYTLIEDKGTPSSVYYRKEGKNLAGKLHTIAEKHKNKDSKIICDIATQFENIINFMSVSGFLDSCKENPSYLPSTNQSFVSMPTPLFTTGKKDENGNDITERDLKSFSKLMNEYQLLDIIKKENEFYKKETVPYVTQKKKGTLTAKQVEDYKIKYLKHLKEVSTLAKKIDQKLPDIEDVKKHPEKYPLISKNPSFQAVLSSRWKPYLKRTANAFNTTFDLMSKGWPLQDITFLMSEVHSFNYLKDRATSNDPNISKDELEAAKKEYNIKKDFFEVTLQTPVKTLKDRKNVLTQLHSIIKKSEPTSFSLDFIDANLNHPICENELNTSFAVKIDILNQKESNNLSFNTGARRAMTSNLLKSMKKVDYVMFGRGSDEFNDMLTSLEELDNYTQENINPENIKKDGLGEIDRYYHCVCNSLTKIKTYLMRKKEQFEKDPNRKNDPKKQKREQPRIKAAIDAYEKLSEDLASIEKKIVILNKEQNDKFLDKQLSTLLKKRNSNSITKEQYTQSVVASIKMLTLKQDNVYKLRENENIASFVHRLAEIRKPDNYYDIKKGRINEVLLEDCIKDKYIKDTYKNIMNSDIENVITTNQRNTDNNYRKNPAETTNNAINRVLESNKGKQASEKYATKEASMYLDFAKKNLIAKPQVIKAVNKPAPKGPSM